MTTYTYPGVYIQEFEPGAPIAGVGTSTAAFIGPLPSGDPNSPVKFTSWDAFKKAYGDLPWNGFFLWYAVRGFFENGGTVCYVVRATSGTYDSVPVPDNAAAQPAPGTAQDTIVVRAKKLGASSGLTVQADQSPLITNKKLYRPTGGPGISNVNGSELQTDDAVKAARYVPGDVIDVGGTPYTVARVAGASIFVTAPVGGSPTGAIRLADTVANTTDSFRVDQPTGSLISAGTALKLSQTGKNDSYVVVRSVSVQHPSPALTTYRVNLRTPMTESYDLTSDVRIDSFEFKLTVSGSPAYDHLSMDPAHPRYFASVIASDPNAKVVASPEVPPSTTPVPFNNPDTGGAALPLGGGADDNPNALGAGEYANALDALEAVDDVNILCAPDSQDIGVQGELRGHCERMMDRFAVLDSKLGIQPSGATSIVTQRNALDSEKGYAALYYPWIAVPGATGNDTLLVPPCGHVAGIYARTDELRGVHKAPAGADAGITGALGVELPLSDIDQGQLNPLGINVIRVFKPGGQPVVWGARTTATDTNWQYVSTRRLFEYLEESIQEGINWAVFEPNNLELWQKLKRTIGDFLTRAWRDGALFGATAEEAFYVRIDEALNPFDLRQLGQLHIEIGVCPVYPAEFIVVHIGIWQGGSQITES